MAKQKLDAAMNTGIQMKMKKNQVLFSEVSGSAGTQIEMLLAAFCKRKSLLLK
jgi:hypothetical protein